MADGMKNVRGVWLPKGEQHILGFATSDDWKYQHGKYVAALARVRQRRVAVDVGAHCGLWSRTMAQDFAHVHAFEPVPLHRACYAKNVTGSYTLHQVALGNERKRVAMRCNPNSSGDTDVQDGDEVDMHRLDDYALENVDFLKIDCEGYECFVVQGGEEMITRCRPCIIVEQKPKNGPKYGLQERQAVDFLMSLGMQTHEKISGDYILTFPEA